MHTDIQHTAYTHTLVTLETPHPESQYPPACVVFSLLLPPPSSHPPLGSPAPAPSPLQAGIT